MTCVGNVYIILCIVVDQQRPAGHYALFCAAAVSLGGFVFGYDASIISGAITLVSRDFSLNDWQTGFLVGSPTLGAVIAAIFAGAAADLIGRKKVLLGIAFLYLLSGVVAALAPSYSWLLIARFIGGLAFASLMLAPVYIAEISPPESRGVLVSINQLNIVLGFSAAYFSNFVLLKLSASHLGWTAALGIDSHAWRWMLGSEMLPAAIWFLLLFAIPESPRWLVMRGNSASARSVFKALYPRRSEGELAALTEIVQATASRGERSLRQRLAQLWSPSLRYALIVGTLVGIAQQITGVNAVYFYAPVIFEQTGVGTNAAFAQAVWVGVINVVFTIIAMIAIDRWGRKPLLVAGLTGVFLSMMICSWGFNQARYELKSADVASLATIVDTGQLAPLVDREFDSDVAFKRALRVSLGDLHAKSAEGALIQAAIRISSTTVLIGVLGFVASFAVSLGPVMWVLFSEIFPNNIRGLAISFVGLINSAVSFVVQLVFPSELSTLGASWTFLLYGLFALASLAFVVWLLPETRGKSLEQLETEFKRRAVRAVSQ